jgi:hypothetical protein
LQQEINLHIKVIAKTNETEYEVPCTSGIRGCRKCLVIRCWVVCVCVCVCGVCVCGVCGVCVCVRERERELPRCSADSLFGHFGRSKECVYDTHEAETLARN